MLNASVKIIAKVLANRLREVLGDIIKDHQTGLLKSRSILDSIVIAKEVLHSTKRNKTRDFTLKMGFEKNLPYDGMGMHLGNLALLGFTSTWISRIRLWLQSANVSVLVNGIQDREIYCKRDLHHSDPLSPLIFVLVADRLHHMIAECREEGHIKGLGSRDDTNIVINLHYADDTLIFGEECLSQAMILKWILFCYEMWSKLKFNFHKSFLIFLVDISVNDFLLSLVFNCPV